MKAVKKYKIYEKMDENSIENDLKEKRNLLSMALLSFIDRLDIVLHFAFSENDRD